MLRWYAEKVTESTHGKVDVRTPAGFELARRVLFDLQKTRRAMEPMVVEWSFPVEVKLSTEPDSTTGVWVSPEIFVYIPEQWERDNLLYLDFDETWLKR